MTTTFLFSLFDKRLKNLELRLQSAAPQSHAVAQESSGGGGMEEQEATTGRGSFVAFILSSSPGVLTPLVSPTPAPTDKPGMEVGVGAITLRGRSAAAADD